jgi:hypothetical protein
VRRFPGVIRDECGSLDPELPPNVCEVRNHKGEVLYADALTEVRRRISDGVTGRTGIEISR